MTKLQFDTRWSKDDYTRQYTCPYVGFDGFALAQGCKQADIRQIMKGLKRLPW